MRISDWSSDVCSSDLVSLPSLDVTVAEMVASLKRVAGNRHLGEITVEPDPFIERIVAGWPVASESSRARALGLATDDGLRSEERRVGKEGVSTCRSRGSQEH